MRRTSVAPFGALAAEHRASWMKDGRWGVMNHYLADWKAQENHLEMNVEEWNKLVDHFDVAALADQLATVGASWYQISLGQNSGFYLAPNDTYDRIVGQPGHCSRRDLVADLYSGTAQTQHSPTGLPSIRRSQSRFERGFQTGLAQRALS